MDIVLEKLRTLRENWLAATGITVLSLVIIFFVLITTGRVDCEITSLRHGVYKTCDCKGLEIAVKSTTNSGEQKTVCIGVISNSKSYQ